MIFIVLLVILFGQQIETIEPDDYFDSYDSDLESDDVIDLNVGGQKITTLRSTLTAVPNSKLALKFAKTNKNQIKSKAKQNSERYFFDYNPVQFQYLLDQLRAIKRKPKTPAYELKFKAPNIDVPIDFFDMIYELGLNRDHFLSPFFGTHVNLTVNSLIGWTECYRSTYNTPFDMKVFNSICKGNRLLVACRPSTNETTLTVAGIGEREDLLQPCTNNYCTTTLKHNTGFYYMENNVWGFEGRPENFTTTIYNQHDWYGRYSGTMQGSVFIKQRNSYGRHWGTTQAPVLINQCDDSNEYPQYRLCWSLRSNDGGERCGGSKNLRNTSEWERLIYQPA